jgi:CHAD domain-containing protein
MRVATRRLRASLSVFQPAFPPKQFEKFERKISYLTDALGDARDTDVFLEFLNEHLSTLTLERTHEEFGLNDFIRHLRKKRDDLQLDLLKTLKRLDPSELKNDGGRLLDAMPADDFESKGGVNG